MALTLQESGGPVYVRGDGAATEFVLDLKAISGSQGANVFNSNVLGDIDSVPLVSIYMLDGTPPPSVTATPKGDSKILFKFTPAIPVATLAGAAGVAALHFVVEFKGACKCD